MQLSVYNALLQRKAMGRKALGVLIDPDKTNPKALARLLEKGEGVGLDYWLLGGSLLLRQATEECLHILKQGSVPVLLFPGDARQVVPGADALLLLSLISGRNPELLIGQHVAAAMQIKQQCSEVIPTGYILVDGGRITSVMYMSGTLPIPRDKTDIALSTALAGELLGLKLLYLEAGSGAKYPVPASMIAAIHEYCQLPLIVGGGIRTPEDAEKACLAGADMLVVGTALEEDSSLLPELVAAVQAISNKTQPL
ncbi:MAG: geranylgeranylglyceryl/heptaprenylglyceryl phosphate synthase [Chitinophagales bacterium]|nr:geranylgeranylglyceryl/heptaprenylglyceryl phosphate synthase [Chitinophagales bacterium]